MAERNGVVVLKNLVVKKVVNVAAGISTLVAEVDFKGDTYTVTLEKTGPFEDDMNARPNGTIDIRWAFDKAASQ